MDVIDRVSLIHVNIRYGTFDNNERSTSYSIVPEITRIVVAVGNKQKFCNRKGKMFPFSPVSTWKSIRFLVIIFYRLLRQRVQSVFFGRQLLPHLLHPLFFAFSLYDSSYFRKKRKKRKHVRWWGCVDGLPALLLMAQTCHRNFSVFLFFPFFFWSLTSKLLDSKETISLRQSALYISNLEEVYL